MGETRETGQKGNGGEGRDKRGPSETVRERKRKRWGVPAGKNPSKAVTGKRPTAGQGKSRYKRKRLNRPPEEKGSREGRGGGGKIKVLYFQYIP